MDDFIKSLGIKLKIQSANSTNTGRIAQMTQKTNQFNLTTRRYTENDLNAMLASGAIIWCLSISDRFGDSGITGAMIVKRDEIDELLLSCRILGKGIEKEFITQILEKLKESGITELKATYIPTKKNVLVKNFYESIGFTLISEDSDGIKRYFFNMTDYNAKFDDTYNVVFI